MIISFNRIPPELKDRPQWVVWKEGKVPYSVHGKPAKANDPSTWGPYLEATRRCDEPGYLGIGYEFSADDPYVGVDLDGCRNPDTKEVSPWAKQIIQDLNTYAEVSPSETGVKLWLRGTLQADWHKVELPDEPRVCDKMPAIEVYDRGRYFAVTGWRLKGPHGIEERQQELDTLVAKHKPQHAAPTADFYSSSAVVERARKYLDRMPPAVSGSNGHGATYRVACVLVQGFALDRSEAFGVLSEYNQRCEPPWSERELNHKLDDAFKVQGQRGYLRDVTPHGWNSIKVPDYKAPAPKPKPKVTTLGDAARSYLEVLKQGKDTLIETGMPDLDYTLGGGVEPGEMVILAARPSHGKSAVALQMIHHWTRQGSTCLLISEEMSAIALGKRVLTFASEVPREHWQTSMSEVEQQLCSFSAGRAKCYLAESCRTAEAAVELVGRMTEERGVERVVVDYAGLLNSPGKSRYEQQTATSAALRRAASEHKVVMLVQCQLNREIEKRTVYKPQLSDLRDTGQFEQDADVVIATCWPHRIDPQNDPFEFMLFVMKNRNREINGGGAVKCRFEPSRQMFSDAKPENYEESFDAWNEGRDWT